MSEDSLVVPRFYILTTKNDAKSKTEGRPIYDDMETVEVRFAGDRNKVSVFPAHVMCGTTQDDDGDFRPMTYAERWPKQYARFKAKAQQVAEGTPIDELTFLTQAQRHTLKDLSVFTAEALSSLDGVPLKNLGQGGRDLKNQAQAYLNRAAGSADTLRLAKENGELKQRLAELLAEKSAVPVAAESTSQFMAWTSDQIKDWIEQQINERPRGNPSHSTLVTRADEIAFGLSETQAA